MSTRRAPMTACCAGALRARSRRAQQCGSTPRSTARCRARRGAAPERSTRTCQRGQGAPRDPSAAFGRCNAVPGGSAPVLAVSQPQPDLPERAVVHRVRDAERVAGTRDQPIVLTIDPLLGLLGGGIGNQRARQRRVRVRRKAPDHPDVPRSERPQTDVTERRCDRREREHAVSVGRRYRACPCGRGCATPSGPFVQGPGEDPRGYLVAAGPRRAGRASKSTTRAGIFGHFRSIDAEIRSRMLFRQRFDRATCDEALTCAEALVCCRRRAPADDPARGFL